MARTGGAEEGALLKLDLLEGDAESWVERLGHIHAYVDQ